MKRLKPSFPLTVSMVSEHHEETVELFRRKPPRKRECFIGVCILDGTFLCDDADKLYSSLSVGERLELSYRKEQSERTPIMPISAVRADMSEIGALPFEYSIIPSMLASRGIRSYCYVEAKSQSGGLVSVAVSVYCEKY